MEVVAEDLRQGLEGDELGIAAGEGKGAIEQGRIARKEVACAVDEEAGRRAFQVGEDRREDGIVAEGVAGILLTDRSPGVLRFYSSGERLSVKSWWQRGVRGQSAGTETKPRAAVPANLIV